MNTDLHKKFIIYCEELENILRMIVDKLSIIESDPLKQIYFLLSDLEQAKLINEKDKESITEIFMIRDRIKVEKFPDPAFELELFNKLQKTIDFLKVKFLSWDSKR